MKETKEALRKMENGKVNRAMEQNNILFHTTYSKKRKNVETIKGRKEKKFISIIEIGETSKK